VNDQSLVAVSDVLWSAYTLVFYMVDSEQISVLRVIDGRMDVDEEFHR